MLNKFNTFIIIVALTALTTAVKGQTAEDSIKAVINTTFVGMKNGDTNLIKTCFTEGAILQTFVRQKDGKMGLTKESVSDFCKAIASIPKGMVANEQIVFKDLKIDGSMAAVWAPFKLYFDGKF